MRGPATYGSMPKPPKGVPHLTIMQGRAPTTKVHASEALAKSAVQMALYGGTPVAFDIALYRWDSKTEGWALVHEIPRGTPRPPWVKQ